MTNICVNYQFHHRHEYNQLLYLSMTIQLQLGTQQIEDLKLENVIEKNGQPMHIIELVNQIKMKFRSFDQRETFVP